VAQQASGVGAELKNGAQQLADHARQGIPRAVNEAQNNLNVHDHNVHDHNAHNNYQQQQHGQQQQQYGQGQQQQYGGVPISQVHDAAAHAEPQPDPLAHRSPQHIPAHAQQQQQGSNEEVKQTLAQQIANGIKQHMPGMGKHSVDAHHLRKEAEYAAHRTQHEAEAAGHRVEEAAHRAEEAVHRAEDEIQRRT